MKAKAGEQGKGRDCKRRKDVTRPWNKSKVYRCINDTGYRCGANALCHASFLNGTWHFIPKDTQ